MTVNAIRIQREKKKMMGNIILMIEARSNDNKKSLRYFINFNCLKTGVINFLQSTTPYQPKPNKTLST